MKNLILIGASGHGKVVADIAKTIGYSDISFLDHAFPEKLKNGIWDIIGSPKDYMQRIVKDTEYFISIGNNKIREKISLEFDLKNCPVLSHPSSIISNYSKIEQGTLIVAGTIINIGTSIGKFVIVNTGASIDHDCKIDDFVHISPGARLAGNVSIGARTWVGIGAVIRENTTIGKDVIIGAGAVVINDVADGETVFGVPAVPIERKI